MTAQITLSIPGGVTARVDIDMGGSLGEELNGLLHINQLQVANLCRPLKGIFTDSVFKGIKTVTVVCNKIFIIQILFDYVIYPRQHKGSICTGPYGQVDMGLVCSSGKTGINNNQLCPILKPFYELTDMGYVDVLANM